MNEKIQKLAEQAGLMHILADHVKQYPGYQEPIEKFAELIIAKCIKEAGDPADGLIKGNTWHDGVRASIWSIKQYFGVK